MPRGFVRRNPVAEVKKSIHKVLAKLQTKEAYDADVNVISESEEQKVLEVCYRKDSKNPQNYSTSGGLDVALLLHTGLRCGEYIALRWKDYDQNSGCLTIDKSRTLSRTDDGKAKGSMVESETKNYKARVIGLLDEAINDLEKIRSRGHHIGPDDFICITRTGNPNTTTNLEARVGKIYKEAGCPEYNQSLHTLRKTFATRMFDRGVPILTIADYLGDLPSTVEKYYISTRKSIITESGKKHIVENPLKKNKE